MKSPIPAHYKTSNIRAVAILKGVIELLVVACFARGPTCEEERWPCAMEPNIGKYRTSRCLIIDQHLVAKIFDPGCIHRISFLMASMENAGLGEITDWIDVEPRPAILTIKGTKMSLREDCNDDIFV